MLIDSHSITRNAERLGWSQSDLARNARMPRATVSHIVRRGSAHPQSVRRIAEALGCAVDDLRPRTDSFASDPRGAS
ncbi:MAG: helix-turn-helix transcriptional regulator [Acidimicrobiales bacterium]